MTFVEALNSNINSIHLQIIKKAVNPKRHRAYTVRVCVDHRMGYTVLVPRRTRGRAKRIELPSFPRPK